MYYLRIIKMYAWLNITYPLQLVNVNFIPIINKFMLIELIMLN